MKVVRKLMDCPPGRDMVEQEIVVPEAYVRGLLDQMAAKADKKCIFLAADLLVRATFVVEPGEERATEVPHFPMPTGAATCAS